MRALAINGKLPKDKPRYTPRIDVDSYAPIGAGAESAHYAQLQFSDGRVVRRKMGIMPYEMRLREHESDHAPCTHKFVLQTIAQHLLTMDGCKGQVRRPVAIYVEVS